MVPKDQRALVCPPLSFTSIGQPFIPIAHPTIPGLSLTLPHPKDDPQHQLRVLNDLERVQRWLDGPPYPYTMEDATGWNDILLERWTTAFERIVMEPGLDLGHAGPSSSCGLQNTRVADLTAGEEVGQGRWIGDLGVVRWEFPNVVDAAERAKLTAENAAREVGDPDLIWTLGCEHTGSRILTHALCGR